MLTVHRRLILKKQQLQQRAVINMSLRMSNIVRGILPGKADHFHAMSVGSGRFHTAAFHSLLYISISKPKPGVEPKTVKHISWFWLTHTDAKYMSIGFSGPTDAKSVSRLVGVHLYAASK